MHTFLNFWGSILRKKSSIWKDETRKLFLPPEWMKKEGGRNETKELQKEFREEGGTNNMRLRDQCFEEIVLNLFSILLLEARLWCEYFSLIFNEIKRNFLSGRNPLSSVGIFYPTTSSCGSSSEAVRWATERGSELTAKIACDRHTIKWGKSRRKFRVEVRYTQESYFLYEKDIVIV